MADRWLSFVGVLGASNYTYVEASWSQSLPDWIASHVRMLAFFGRTPGQLVSDNLKAGVAKAFGLALEPMAGRRPHSTSRR